MTTRKRRVSVVVLSSCFLCLVFLGVLLPNPVLARVTVEARSGEYSGRSAYSTPETSPPTISTNAQHIKLDESPFGADAKPGDWESPNSMRIQITPSPWNQVDYPIWLTVLDVVVLLVSTWWWM
jgi:hypothetical protein